MSFTDDLKYINDTLNTENNTISRNARQSTDCNPSLTELIDLQHQFNFNSLPQNSSINKIFDYNRSKDLKNINDFKLKQFDNIFENDFNDLDEDLFELKKDCASNYRPILIEEKIYDNRNREANYQESSKDKEGSYI